MRKVEPSAILFAGVSILYPILAAVAVHRFGPGWVVLALLALLAFRVLIGLNNKAAPSGALTWGLLVAAAAVGVVALFDHELSVRLYPAFQSATMLAAFGATLIKPPSMIERFARMVQPDLPERGVRYARNVTWIWCGFFVLNGAIAIWTALFASWHTWTLYNGVIAYIAMGALFLGEFLVRPFFRNEPKAAR